MCMCMRFILHFPLPLRLGEAVHMQALLFRIKRASQIKRWLIKVPFSTPVADGCLLVADASLSLVVPIHHRQEPTNNLGIQHAN